MSSTYEKTMPSGAVLKITLAPFAVGKALFQAFAQEAANVRLDSKLLEVEVDLDLIKNLVCMGVASSKIDTALNKCFEKVTYNSIRVTADTFEDENARQDYVPALVEVATVNLRPFLKNLASLSGLLDGLTTGSPASKATPSTKP